MSVASIDESAENYPETGKAPHSVQTYKALYVMHTQGCDLVLVQLVPHEQGHGAKLEEEVEVERGGNCSENKVKCE